MQLNYLQNSENKYRGVTSEICSEKHVLMAVIDNEYLDCLEDFCPK